VEKQPVFIHMNESVRKILVEQGVDVIRELKKQGLDVERSFQADPASGKETHRDVTLVILASAIAINALATAIAKIIDAHSRKPVITKEIGYGPILDKNGNVVRDENGNPVLGWMEKPVLLESSQKPQENSRAKFSFLGLSFETAGGDAANTAGKS